MERTQDWFTIGYDIKIDIDTHTYRDFRISGEKLQKMKSYIDNTKIRCQQTLNNTEMEITVGNER